VRKSHPGSNGGNTLLVGCEQRGNARKTAALISTSLARKPQQKKTQQKRAEQNPIKKKRKIPLFPKLELCARSLLVDKGPFSIRSEVNTPVRQQKRPQPGPGGGLTDPRWAGDVIRKGDKKPKILIRGDTKEGLPPGNWSYTREQGGDAHDSSRSLTQREKSEFLFNTEMLTGFLTTPRIFYFDTDGIL